ncbi:MAG: YcxB family protein, partial [Lachnospiraceae bacterium]|nr:YcxB family protein [Lachnospiraceae bacterium]
QGDDVVFVLWEQLFRVIATKKSILIYTSPVNAWILPRKDLGGNAELLKSTIITNMPAAKIKNMK